MKLNCVIIDDEPLAVKLLESYVDQTTFLNLKNSFNSAIEAIPYISEETIDLLFLDINMPNLNGLDFAKTLPSTCKIIFTTAYDQYAVEGFKVNALDYLLKPISYADFLKASTRALDWHKKGSGGKENSTNSIFVKSGYRAEKLDYDQILYIENQKDYVKFYLEGQKEPISSLMNLQFLSEKLPKDKFMRVHRSFIVNLDKVKTVERSSIIFGKVYIPVSDSYKDTFSKFMESKMI